jgi:hypothetical protein
MTDLGPGQFGKLLLIIGAVLMALGAAMLLLSKFGFFRLPGDIELGGRNWKVYLPIMSCLVLSVFLTLILWMVNGFRK